MSTGGTEFRIARLAFDEDVRRILDATAMTPISVKQIAERLQIPIAYSYRLVRQMSSAEMLKSVKQRGSEVSLYSSNLHSIDLRIEHECLNLVIEFSDGERKVFEVLSHFGSPPEAHG